jgi:hypothetical protein
MLSSESEAVFLLNTDMNLWLATLLHLGELRQVEDALHYFKSLST